MNIIVLSSTMPKSCNGTQTKKPQILMVKTEGFHKVVRASADTPQKPQISKLLPPALADSHIIRAYKRVRFQRPYHTMDALTSEHHLTASSI